MPSSAQTQGRKIRYNQKILLYIKCQRVSIQKPWTVDLCVIWWFLVKQDSFFLLLEPILLMSVEAGLACGANKKRHNLAILLSRHLLTIGKKVWEIWHWWLTFWDLSCGLFSYVEGNRAHLPLIGGAIPSPWNLVNLWACEGDQSQVSCVRRKEVRDCIHFLLWPVIWYSKADALSFMLNPSLGGIPLQGLFREEFLAAGFHWSGAGIGGRAASVIQGPCIQITFISQWWDSVSHLMGHTPCSNDSINFVTGLSLQLPLEHWPSPQEWLIHQKRPSDSWWPMAAINSFNQK